MTQNPVGVDAQGNKQVIYYRVNFRERTTMCEPDGEGQTQEIPPLMSGVTTVFYVNTETYSPLIAAYWQLEMREYPLFLPIVAWAI